MSIKQRFIYKASIGFSLGVLIVILVEIIICFIETGDVSAYANEVRASASAGFGSPRYLVVLVDGLDSDVRYLGL